PPPSLVGPWVRLRGRLKLHPGEGRCFRVVTALVLEPQLRLRLGSSRPSFREGRNVNQVGGDQERAGGPLKSGLLLTKLYAPAPREQMVARDRLLERLRPRADAKLTLVAAPAGCGKTTLLAAWYEDEARRRPVAWVTVDDGDNDAVVFWCHILEALRRVRP